MIYGMSLINSARNCTSRVNIVFVFVCKGFKYRGLDLFMVIGVASLHAFIVGRRLLDHI